MRKVITLSAILLFIFSINIFSQSSANYTFATNSTGSLALDLNGNTVDMTTGTTTTSVSSVDQGTSGAISIGFDFWLMGIRYNQFSATTNGLVGLSNSGTSASGSVYVVSGGTVALPIISAFAADLGTGTLGKVQYKLIGTAPNRTLVIEFTNMTLLWTTSYTNDGTYQVRLYENKGIVEFVYGTMSITSTSSASDATVAIGFAVNTINNSLAYVTSSTNTSSTIAPFTDNATYAVGPIANLNSAANGSRRVYSFTPVAPNGSPSNLSFSAVGSGGMTLTWNDNSSNEVGFPIYASTNGGLSYNYLTQAAASGGSTQSSIISGLTPGTTYTFLVYGVTEGYLSPSFATGSQATLPPTPVCGVKTIGPGGNYATITAGVSDIVSNGMCGAAIFELLPTYVSTTETFPISFSSISAIVTATNTLTIRPQTGATSRVITSANTTATIDLNGCSFITFDGRQGGAGVALDLKLDNTSTSGAVVRFINTALNNTIKYCTVTGVNTSTTSGVIFFSTSNLITQGNNNNLIDNCDIKDGATQPVNLIYSSGSSTAGLLNQNNTVSNCFLSNFFSAGSVTNGIFLTTGNTLWTITGNRIFQTVSRTYTTGNIHDAITITSSTGGAGGFVINNNIIGYATSAGTGTYTMLGTLANRFICINVTQSITGAVTNIQGNTMTNFALNSSSGATTTNGVWCGISLQSGDFNIGTTAGNFIGDATTNNAISTTITTGGGLTVGINDASTGNVTINNTTIGSITAVGTTVSITPAITAIQVTNGIPTITNNTIGSPSVANSINNGALAYTNLLAGTVLGINVTVVTGATTINNNSIRNLSNSGTTTSHATRGIIYSSTSPVTINNNTISNLQCAGSVAGVTGLANVNGIIVNGTALGGAQVKGNTIFTLNSSNAGLFATGTVGIAISNPGTQEVSFNKIYDLRNASTMAVVTTPPVCAGIQFRAGPDSIRIFNNMVSIGNAQTTNTEFIGILNNFSTIAVLKASFNSINIEGTATAGALPSFCFYRGDFGVGSAILTPVVINNNLFNNTRTGGTGKHYAIGNQQTSASTGWVAANVNNNVLNSAVASTIGLWSVTDQTFAQWKTSSLGDAASISGVAVTFTASATGDLHLNMGVTPTAIESGGIPYAGITTDIDGQVRPGPAGSVNGGATAPDIGADEFDGVPKDIIAPTINYTLLGSGPAAGTRSFTNITATDNSGINGSLGTRPRCYYKKTGDANDLTGWKYVEANGSVSPFDFTINYTLLNAGSVSVGDVIQYFVVAQDNSVATNVGINSGIFAATPTSVALTGAQFGITGTINQYSITANVYNGTSYTVGTLGGETWSSFTNAGGFFDALNNGVISGNVTVTVTSDIATETGAITLNPIAEDGPGGYTVSVVPSFSVLKTISGNPGGTVALIKMNGNKRVTIDGRYRGAGSYLAFVNTNITAGTGGETFQINNGSSAILLEYLTIQGNVQSGVGGVVNVAGTTGSVGNSNITVDNCNISNYTGGNPYFGISTTGQSQSINNSNITFSNNNIFDWGVNSSVTSNSFGLLISNTSGSTFSGNSLYRTTALTSSLLVDFVFLTGSGTGAGNTLSGNYLGGTAPLCGGTPFTTTTSSGIYGFDITDISLHTTSTTAVNNTVKNIAITCSGSGTIFCGIFNRTGAGACSISGNQIGDNTVDASVSPSIFNSNTTAGLTQAFEGIDSRSGNGAITNNNIGGFRSIRTSTGLTSMNMILSATQGTKNITGNLIGSLSTSNGGPNKISQEEIENLKKLPNYEPGETAPKVTVNKFLSTNKEGKVIVLASKDEIKADGISDMDSKTDERNTLNEKMRIEQERNGGKTSELSKVNSENLNTESKKINSDNLLPLPKVDNIKQKGSNDSPLATIANISQEAPAQIVPIFSSGFGGTVSNNTIANIVINTGAVTAPIVNLLSLSNASSPSQNCIVTNNTIRNISMVHSVAGTQGGFVLATTYPGILTCSGNTMSVINVAPLVAASVGFVCVQSTGTGFHNITSNTISTVTCGGNESGGAFTGILETVTAPATTTVSNNIIQNWTLNSTISSIHTFNGILLSGGTGDFTVSGNTVDNIVTNSNSALSSSGNNVFSGIFGTNTSATNSPTANQITGNTITNATCNPFTAATSIKLQGIFQSASGSSWNITKNYVTGLLTNSTATTTMINGFNSFLGSRITMSNNIFDLGNGITTDNTVIAVYDDSVGPIEFFYNNTWRVRGTVGAGTTNTAIFFRNTTSSAITEMKNNIMSNERTGGTGSHMVINNNSNGATNWNISDYNDYYSVNPNTIGRWVATDLNLATWKTTSGKDARTFSNLPSFTATDRINASDLSVSGRGTYISSVTTDIDGDSRPTAMSTSVKPVDVGADQYLPSGFTGNTCVYDGVSVYKDGGLNSVEFVSGTYSVTTVKQFPGVRSPFNTTGKPVNGNGNNNNSNSKGNNNNNNQQKVKDGRSGGEEMLVPVNEPWIYWELSGFTNTTDLVMKFYYNPEQLATISEANLRLTYWNGTAWENSFAPQSVNTSLHYIQVALPANWTWNSPSHFAIEDNASPMPVNICSFTNNVSGRDINLVWTTCQEVNNRGFYVERRTLVDEKAGRFSDWISLGFVQGHGTSNEQHLYSYSDKKLLTGKFEYRLKQIDYNSNSEYFALNKLVEIGKPNNAEISQNYPNPSNPKSKIDFQIPFDSKITIKVYDEVGKEVTTIINESRVAGFYTTEFDGTNLASGVYFYRIFAEGSGQKFTKTMKMILVK